MTRPRDDDYDDEAWMDAPPAHIGSLYPLSERPKRKVKKPEFPIGFDISAAVRANLERTAKTLAPALRRLAEGPHKRRRKKKER